jgi:hypothetical protein
MDASRHNRILPQMMKPADDVGSFNPYRDHALIGETIGQLTIIAFAGSGRGKRTAFQVSCADCGRTFVARVPKIAAGECGCAPTRTPQP